MLHYNDEIISAFDFVAVCRPESAGFDNSPARAAKCPLAGRVAAMNYAQVLDALADASLFDLYRLSVAIDQQLKDPQRQLAVKAQLRVGQTVEYFDQRENRTIAARVIRLQRSYVEVSDLRDGKEWRVPYYMLNLRQVDTRLPDSRQTGLSRQSLSVGDWVGFVDKHGIEHAGQIHKLNPKTASLHCPDGRWRVAYGLLFRVLDPGIDEAGVIEHQPD